MKKFLSAAIALSLLGSTAYAAQSYDANRQGQYSGPDQSQQQWSRGGRMPDQYRQQQYQVNDWQQRRLEAPPNGYGWYRNDNNQYLLAAIATGVIANIVSQNQYQNDAGYRDERGYRNDRQWSRGEQLSPEYRDNRYVVSDWRGRSLSRPGWRNEWLQVGNQFVLIRTRSGMIIDVVAVSNNQYYRNDRDGRDYRDSRDYRNN